VETLEWRNNFSCRWGWGAGGRLGDCLLDAGCVLRFVDWLAASLREFFVNRFPQGFISFRSDNELIEKVCYYL
jgi:hypothetical protein